MLSCSELRNITIVIIVARGYDPFHIKIRDMFLSSIRELIMNEDCFMVNFYLKSKEGYVRVRKDDDLHYLIDRGEGHMGWKNSWHVY